jgi:serine/threonine protein kinase
MCNKIKKCRGWVSLEHVGVHAEGCIKDDSWINNVKIQSNQSIFNSSLYIDLPTEKLTFLKNVSHGKFGFIDLASYDTKTKHMEVYVKRPIIPGKSLLYEACIQKLVRDNLSTIGFPTGAPPLLSIFRLKDNSICFAMEQITGSITLDKYLDTVPKNQLSSVIIDCLLQLCAMTWYLDNTLGINHRDLKPSNFLIVVHDTPIRKVLHVDDIIIEIESKHSLTFIDFGFSCVGSTETHISDISLSTVYSKSDPCPKEGRDMYLFLAFLYIDYHSKISPKLLSLFESWLDIDGSNLCSFMRKDKENSKKWIYFITGNDKIKSFKSSPCAIIKDLQ